MKVKMDRWVKILLAVNIVVVVALLAVVVVSSLRSTPGVPAQLNPSASPSPDLMQMGLAHIPTSASCLLCHETGGEGGLKPIPAIGHPLEGWRSCSACHTDESLGRTAPGHTGIPEAECLNCHKVAEEGPAITQPHSNLQDKHCLDCHGSYAHLPTSMVERDETECWLCHKPTAYPPPDSPHLHDTRLSCRECHQSSQVGGLPIDHALRADTTCLLCHDIAVAQGGPSPTAPGPSPSASPSASSDSGG